MKIKVINLLINLANGVTYTKKARIRYFDRKNDYEDECILNEVAIGYRLYNQNIELNDEVEIVEEKKITPTDFENLGYALGSIQKYINKGYNKAIEEKKIPDKWNDLSFTTMRKKEDSIDDDIHKLKGYIETIMRTQNEVIDYLKSKGE